MKIKTINNKNISHLREAFLDYLLDNGIIVSKIGLVVEDDKLKLLLVPKSEETLSVFEFEKEKCIGLEIDVIVSSIIDPVLPRLKEKQGSKCN